MSHSTAGAAPVAIPLPAEQLAALLPLLPLLGDIARLLLDFRRRPVCPKATHDLEAALAGLTRALGRVALGHTFNCLEPDQPDEVPAEVRLGGSRYRRRQKSPAAVDSTFGTLRLRRWLYEPRDPGERCLFPLEHLLGLVAGRATPALADRAGRLLAQGGQREALAALAEGHGLRWSHEALRRVSAEAALVVGGQQQQAQAGQLLAWLRQAWRGRGPFDPVLAVGRDGVMVPTRQDGYHEAAVATLSVYDRRGRRLGTCYLGWMPQAGQAELSGQLTALLVAVLVAWKGRRPRLAYLSDGGWQPEEYYRGVLHRMADPGRPGRRLCWQRVLDYYHAAGYLTKMAEALFGPGAAGERWAGRMRGWLKQGGGLKRVLQSASYHRNRQGLRGGRRRAFWKAYCYLWKRRRQMDYARYRREGLPIGSGVTEAGCKVVVSQRLKRSGMGWGLPGGQVVLTLRVAWLSGVWRRAWDAHLAEPVHAILDSYEPCLHPQAPLAA